MPADAAALLWLRSLERLANRAAHEIKNPLNGAVLNVEVLRTRAARPGAEAAALAPFAEAAAAELARAAALVEALLTLARPVAAPVDLEGLLAPVMTLFRAIAEAQGGALTAERLGGTSGFGRDSLTVRGAVAAALDAAVREGARVRCAAEVREGTTAVRIQSSAGPVMVPDDVRAALRGAGVRLAEESGGVALVFAHEAAGRAQTQGSDEGRQDSHSG